ncbi:MAG: hypothetical protein ACK5GD_17800 [Planctomycetota bacterium]
MINVPEGIKTNFIPMRLVNPFGAWANRSDRCESHIAICIGAQTHCKRFIMGGRGNVRAILFMATLVDIGHNEKIKAYYAHLKSHKKESKFVSPQSLCLFHPAPSLE